MKRSKIRTEERRWRRGDVLAVAAAVAIGAAFAWIVLSIQGLTNELRTANAARDALARQVQTLGVKPVGGPPGSRGEPGKSVVGPQGPPGDPGGPGPRGPSGSPGSPGKNGRNGEPGSNGVGQAGAPGSNGTDGAAGPAGPPGPQGDPGPAGPQGPAGADGKDGTDGKDGRDGQTCPDGYSLRAPSWDPNALVCRRDGAPDPSPSKDGGLLSLGLDPTRRQYA